MTMLYIIGGLITTGLLIKFFQTKKENNSPYLQIKKKLEDDLMQATLSSDWKKKQEVNLQLLWLKTIKEVESLDIFGKKKKTEENSLLSTLTENEIKFPPKWQLDDFYYYPFSQEIIAGYGKILVENDYKVYKPESILPYPKDIIKKAILFTFDYLNYNKALYEVPDKKKVADNLNAVRFILLENFVDASKKPLPKDSIENYRIGKQLRDEQPFKEEEDLHLIDWRSYSAWMAIGAQYADAEKFELALICYDKSKQLNPDNRILRTIIGITYLTMGERHFDKGEKTLAFDYIRKSAELQNKDALKWLNEHK